MRHALQPRPARRRAAPHVRASSFGSKVAAAGWIFVEPKSLCQRIAFSPTTLTRVICEQVRQCERMKASGQRIGANLVV